jgi:hypothetical protein
VDAPLVRRHDLDELLLLPELLDEEPDVGRSVLALLRHEQIARAGAPTEEVLDLALERLDLDVLVVDALVEGRQLALADLPDLREALSRISRTLWN